MRIKIYHRFNALLATLLALLGLGSCEGCGMCMYGTPNIDFQVKGTITDAESRPIKGIKVKVEEQYGDSDTETYHHGLDSVETDENGQYKNRIEAFLSFGGRESIIIITKTTPRPLVHGFGAVLLCVYYFIMMHV